VRKMKHMSHVALQPVSIELAITYSMEIIECAHEIARRVVPVLRDTFVTNKEFVSTKGYVSQSKSWLGILSTNLSHFTHYICSYTLHIKT
jgi:hypothetical protein